MTLYRRAQQVLRAGNLENFQLSPGRLQFCKRLLSALLHVVLNELLEAAQAGSCGYDNRLLAKDTQSVFTYHWKRVGWVSKCFGITTGGLPQLLPRRGSETRKRGVGREHLGGGLRSFTSSICVGQMCFKLLKGGFRKRMLQI